MQGQGISEDEFSYEIKAMIPKSAFFSKIQDKKRHSRLTRKPVERRGLKLVEVSLRPCVSQGCSKYAMPKVQTYFSGTV